MRKKFDGNSVWLKFESGLVGDSCEGWGVMSDYNCLN